MEPWAAPAVGPHFLQIPGPTNVPGRILRAIARPTIDHRGPDFARLVAGLLADLRLVFQTRHDVVVFPSSGTGAWEAALVNVTSPGDAVLMAETGHFARLWSELATALGLEPELLPGTWGRGADPERIGERLAADRAHRIKAVCVVHNETSTGAVSPIARIRQAIDAAGHPALLLVDTISSLASIDYRADEWGVDVTVGGSQKGLMLPPGLGFNAVGPKARAAAEAAGTKRAFFDWRPILAANAAGAFPYTPATNMLFGLREALDMLMEEGLPAVFARHARHGAATRRAASAWGLDVLCPEPAEQSGSLTAIVMPPGRSADALRALILARFDMALGNGLARLADRVFRIGHLGHFNDLMLMGTLSGVELGLRESGISLRGSGVAAALETLAAAPQAAVPTVRVAAG